MPWHASKTAYKIVRIDGHDGERPPGQFLSEYLPYNRSISEESGHNDGYCHPDSKILLLSYPLGVLVTSPNGLCTCDDFCCRGIHAYTQEYVAQFKYVINGNFAILELEAERWWQPVDDPEQPSHIYTIVRAEAVTAMRRCSELEQGKETY